MNEQLKRLASEMMREASQENYDGVEYDLLQDGAGAILRSLGRIADLEAENMLVKSLRDEIREYKREIEALKAWQIDAKLTLAVIKGGFDALARLDLPDSGDPQEVTDNDTDS